MSENKPVGVNAKISVSLYDFLCAFRKKSNLKSTGALLLYIAQNEGYKIQPEDL